MATQSAAIDLLHAQIADADTQWSLGTFGGIAEFSRDRDEMVRLTQSATGAAAVSRRVAASPLNYPMTAGHSPSNASPDRAGASGWPSAYRPVIAR